jgi:hypothetical protein
MEIIEWEIEKGRDPIKVVEMSEEITSPPDGFPVAVVFTQVRILETPIIDEMTKIIGRGGVIAAARYLHEEVGNFAAIGDCVNISKKIKNGFMKESIDKKMAIILRNTIFMTEKDWGRYKELPHIEAIDPERRKEQEALVTSKIEWPEEYMGDIYDPDGDYKNTEIPWDLIKGQITTINTQSSKSPSPFKRHK